MNSASPETVQISRRTALSILLKAFLLFLIFNLLFLWLEPLSLLGRISGYNRIYPGRLRLPFGEDLERSYNVSILQPEAMLRSHEVHGQPPTADEFRIVLIGDSSVWGFNLGPDQTLSAMVNQAGLRTSSGARVRAYNMGYPTMSITKDLFLLELSLRYRPDLIVWFVTLESMPRSKQLSSPLLQHNAGVTRQLIRKYDLDLDPLDEAFIESAPLERTIVGQRRELADWARLQMLGIMWGATGVDHDVPEQFQNPSDDVERDTTFQDLEQRELSVEDLSLEVISAGLRAAGEIPVLLVNEPIFIARGENHEVRYNSFYPRWAYDAYRDWMEERVRESGWDYLDLWDRVAPSEFTDSAIHYSPVGVQTVVEQLTDSLDLSHP